MKSTRRGFGRRALSLGLAIFCAITLTSVGFAAWVLSNNANLDSEGGIKTETITDISVKIDITNAYNKVLYDEFDDTGKGIEGTQQNIVFGPLATPADGATDADKHPSNNGQIQNDGLGKSEDLSFTVEGTVDNIDKIGVLRFNVRVPESLITAAGLTRPTNEEGSTWTYDPSKAFIRLPSYAMDINGKPIPYISGKLSTPDENGKVQYQYPQSDDSSTLVVKLVEGENLVWTKDVVWNNPSAALENANTSTKIESEVTLDGTTFQIMPLVQSNNVVPGNLEFVWTVSFEWGARYLGMHPNYFYDVDERVAGTHDTLTAIEDYPHKYTIADMNLVNYDLLLLQTVINGLDITNYLAAGTINAEKSYIDTGIVLVEEATLEDYIKDVENAATIKSSLEKLQTNIATAITMLGTTGYPNAPIYGFWVYADVN